MFLALRVLLRLSMCEKVPGFPILKVCWFEIRKKSLTLTHIKFYESWLNIYRKYGVDVMTV